jgi:hypothetical protein
MQSTCDAIRECEGRDDSADLAPWDGVAENDKLANVGRRHCDFLSGVGCWLKGAGPPHEAYAADTTTVATAGPTAVVVPGPPLPWPPAQFSFQTCKCDIV